MLYLLLGTIIMFLPVLWLVLSSFKTQAGLLRFPPDLLPYDQKTVTVDRLCRAAAALRRDHGRRKQRASWPRCAASVWKAQMVDPANPGEIIKRAASNDRTEVRELRLAWENYTEPLERFNFLVYLRNSMVVTLAPRSSPCSSTAWPHLPWPSTSFAAAPSSSC
jgi:alpha-1,4-digalacturonate transport system permease protein